MTMFEELYALATTATLTMILSADAASGRLTVNVVPRPHQGVGEPALTQALSLTATPQEFDAGFVDAVRGYRAVRQSLEQQAQTTRDAIEAALAASAQKVADTKAKAGVATPAASARNVAQARRPAAPPVEDEEDTRGEDLAGMAGPEAAGAPSTPVQRIGLGCVAAAL